MVIDVEKYLFILVLFGVFIARITPSFFSPQMMNHHKV